MKRKAEDTTKKQIDPWSKTISLRQLWSNRSNLGLTLAAILFIAVLGVSIAGFKKNHESVLSATFQPVPTSSLNSLPTPIQKPVTKQQPTTTQQTNPVQTTSDPQQAPIRHDGSRTGPIVDYFELCTGKTIKIYENERVPYKRINGETVYSTKGDIKCYEEQIAQLKQQANQQNTPNIVVPTPIPGKPTMDCLVTYTCTGNSFHYQVDIDTCNSFQQSALNLCNTFPTSNTSPSISTSPHTTELITCYVGSNSYQATSQQCSNDNCKYNATFNFNGNKTQCYQFQGGPGSAGEACLNIYQQQYQQDLANCDRQFPI